jgi:DNA-binding protein YbaB
MAEEAQVLDDPRIARWVKDDDDFDPAAVIADLEGQRQRMSDARSRLADTNLTVQSPDRLVTITMTGASALTAVDIHPNALQDLGADQLGPLVLRTIQQGMAQAGQIVREQLTGVFDDRQIVEDAMRSWPGTPPDEDAEDQPAGDDPRYFPRH